MAVRPAGRVKPAVAAEALPTREVILDTAERLFSAHGVDGVAVRDLAREMHLTPSSLYNHFPSKRALYDAVLERGLRPIMEMVAEAWQAGALRPDHIRDTLDKLVAHLAVHPHLARLLQRALLEESKTFQTLIGPWLVPLYREGVSVVQRAAGAAGWPMSDVPHLVIGLFGLIFAYFVNASALQGLPGWDTDPLSARSLAQQRRFLEQAIFRLLGARPQPAPRRKKGSP
jgi:AcrR family transcriptional regulator